MGMHESFAFWASRSFEKALTLANIEYPLFQTLTYQMSSITHHTYLRRQWFVFDIFTAIFEKVKPMERRQSWRQYQQSESSNNGLRKAMFPDHCVSLAALSRPDDGPRYIERGISYSHIHHWHICVGFQCAFVQHLHLSPFWPWPCIGWRLICLHCDQGFFENSATWSASDFFLIFHRPFCDISSSWFSANSSMPFSAFLIDCTSNKPTTPTPTPMTIFSNRFSPNSPRVWRQSWKSISVTISPFWRQSPRWPHWIWCHHAKRLNFCHCICLSCRSTPMTAWNCIQYGNVLPPHQRYYFGCSMMEWIVFSCCMCDCMRTYWTINCVWLSSIAKGMRRRRLARWSIWLNDTMDYDCEFRKASFWILISICHSNSLDSYVNRLRSYYYYQIIPLICLSVFSAALQTFLWFMVKSVMHTAFIQ